MKFLLTVLFALTANAFANPLYTTGTFSQWPDFSLQHEFAPAEKDFLAFQETDFTRLKYQIERNGDPMVPTTARRVFDEALTLKDPNIKWRVFMTAVAGNRVSGFSQGIGMTTMLIEDELFLDAQIEHLNYNFKNRYYDKYYEGDKYRYETSLHWYPTDNFSLHLGLSGLVDK